MKTFLATIIMFLTSILAHAQIQKTLHFKAMGVAYSVTLVDSDSLHLAKSLMAAKAKIHAIEKNISSWKPNSQTSKINSNAGIQPVKVSKDLFQLIERSLKVSELTAGAFDISFAAMDKIWQFDGSMTAMPDSATVRVAIAKINYKNILLNKEAQTVFLKEKGMKIGFGGIGKGYAADVTMQYLKENYGIKSGIINAGGDLIAWGKGISGENWQVGIADPVQQNQIVGWLAANETAIVTSGDYEKYVEFGGKRYAHIINPKTGYPTTGIKSVTLLCSIGELADALATAVFVLGKEKGLSLVNQMKGVECLIIDDQNEFHTSNGLIINYKK